MANIGGDTMEKRLEARSRLQPYFVNISTTWWWNDKKNQTDTHTHTPKKSNLQISLRTLCVILFSLEWSFIADEVNQKNLIDFLMSACEAQPYFISHRNACFFFFSSTRSNFSLLTTAREKRDGIRKAYKRTNGQTAAMLNGSCHKSGHFQANFSRSLAT